MHRREKLQTSLQFVAWKNWHESQKIIWWLMIFFSTSITLAIPSVKAGLSLNKNWRLWNKNNDKHSICSAGFIENFSISLSRSCGQEHGLPSKFYFSNFICLPTTQWTDTQEYIAHITIMWSHFLYVEYLIFSVPFYHSRPPTRVLPVAGVHRGQSGRECDPRLLPAWGPPGPHCEVEQGGKLLRSLLRQQAPDCR